MAEIVLLRFENRVIRERREQSPDATAAPRKALLSICSVCGP